jgi:RHS repeat-associated protein
MGYYAVTTHPEKTDPLPKNRVGVFSASARVRARRIPSQLTEPQQRIPPTLTETASGVRYYGHRFYHPETGRWPSRDPIGEDAFLLTSFLPSELLSRVGDGGEFDLYGFSHGNPIGLVDYLGLYAPATCGGSCGDFRTYNCTAHNRSMYWLENVSPGMRRNAIWACATDGCPQGETFIDGTLIPSPSIITSSRVGAPPYDGHPGVGAPPAGQACFWIQSRDWLLRRGAVQREVASTVYQVRCAKCECGIHPADPIFWYRSNVDACGLRALITTWCQLGAVYTSSPS